uniref:Nyctalopin n=1 Tax=Myotis myotis TaxID=51298 RepID=A0A7J7YFJ0_MYOMY|nr:nyctalopin [Myotis myotis]
MLALLLPANVFLAPAFPWDSAPGSQGAWLLE